MPGKGDSVTKFVFDPQQLPVDAVGGESALAPERLGAAWLRHRFAHPPAWEAEVSDEALMRRAHPTPASVLIPLVLREGEMTMLLTQRTAHLTDHAGQISFPGGRAEDFDGSPVETALRESEE